MPRCEDSCVCGRHRQLTQAERDKRVSNAFLQRAAGKLGKPKMAAEKVFVAGKEHSARKVLKPKMKELGIPERCFMCGLGPEWNDQPLVLELDHADGVRSNNELGNLQKLCPNCHSQRPTNAPGSSRPYNEPLMSLWRRQLAFTARALPKIYGKTLEQLNEDDRIELSKDYLLSLHAEIDEILNTMPWKRHRFTGGASREDLLEEVIDTQKFLLGLAIIWGITPLEFERAFNRKSDVVEQRFRQDHELPKLVTNKKVVLVDIDGVVAQWDKGFEQWVRAQHGYEPAEYAKNVDPGLRQRLKDEIHSSGGMAKLPSDGAALLGIDALEAAGYTIVWLTARPVSAHPRVVGDTVEWLKFHDLPTDYIYYSDYNKHLFVVEKFPMTAALFDDTPEIVANAREFGVPAFLVEDYNFRDKVVEFLAFEGVEYAPGTFNGKFRSSKVV